MAIFDIRNKKEEPITAVQYSKKGYVILNDIVDENGPKFAIGDIEDDEVYQIQILDRNEALLLIAALQKAIDLTYGTAPVKR